MMKWLRSILEWVKNLFCKKTMRRKISLYIADQLVDLDDQSFILFNYQMDDLSNPTIVKNSFSQQITLKGTANNNKIFGHYFKTDRRISNTGGDTGTDFNASQKTPFTIYDEMGHILESGYIKLDSISRQGADIQYKVTLYGGLGSFFYALSYDENGNKRNLASLDYLGTSNPERELDFRITAENVKSAWYALRIGGDGFPLLSHTTKVFFLASGAIVATSYEEFYINKYDVSGAGNMTIEIKGHVVLALAVAKDGNGNILQVYDAQSSSAYANDKMSIVLPPGSQTLEVQGRTGANYYDASAKLSGVWDIINFAPAYNGIPEGNFSPDKALVLPSSVGLQDSITEGDGDDAVEYSIKAGYALVNLAEAQDEWAVKDLRSYLQRPIFSMKAFWNAICNPANNGGYEVDASVIQDNVTFRQYSSLWMTLPMITSKGSIQQESGDLSLSMSSTASSGNVIGRYDIDGSVPSGTKVTASLSCKIRFNTPSGANSYTELNNVVSQRVGRNIQSKFSVMFVQAVAYASDDSIVGGSKIKVCGANFTRATPATAAACGYVPAWSADYESVDTPKFKKVSAGVFEIPQEFGFSIEAQDVSYYKILVSVYSGLRLVTEGSGGSSSTSYSGDGSTSTPAMYVDYVTLFTPVSTFIIQGDSGNSITYTSSDSLRSGATITKSMLLSSSHTPAEYMLSFCKIFGLYFTYDNDTRKVTILRRNDLYQDETIDLEKRVDLSKGVTIQPLVFQAKWYDFILDGVGGAFYDEYLNVEGVPYGIQRVNTGYDFNADSVNLMESVVFKNACTILARSKYFNYILQGQVFQPSPFLDKGNTYTLWSADGDTLETNISCPPDSASVTYYNDNPAYKGYDINEARKLELRNADNKPIDGSDILVFLEGWNTYPYFKVTDDVPAMDVVNDGVPCWLLGAGDGENIPIFQRYVYGNIHLVEYSLDFGVPREMDIPGVSIAEGCTIYEKGWKKYISDRYDVNTKVMTCRVNFAGIPVTQELLRKFYWYDNSLWVLNAIRNYSLTTYDPVECEFVQVQDKDNYLNGQTY